MDDSSQDTAKFSVIMPVYNHAAYVAEGVRSVLAQSCGDWELIICDDGSTDSSRRILDELASDDDRIAVIHQANAGPAAARNAAIARARAPWLTYIDSDDVWFPDALANYAEYIADHPDAKFIYGFRHRLDADGVVTELPGEFADAPTGPAELFGRMFLSHLCVCYRRELIDQVGGYDANLRICEDYELYLRISLLTQFEPMGKATGLRRRHGSNLSRQTGFSRMVEAIVLRRFVECQGGSAVIDAELVARRLGRLYYASGRQYFRGGCFRQAAAAMKQAHTWRRTAKGTLIAILSRCLARVGRHDKRQLPQL